MMAALKVMTYFKLSLSTHNWDRAFLMASYHRLQPAAQQADDLAPCPGSSQTMLSLSAEKRREQPTTHKPNCMIT
ncbi:hypothetical protein OI72_19675 [Aeromonas hydrophila]|nr:hypothetical protein OI72_19675 [Aeromonas hydrophila]